jgi:hypothetical protein
MSDVASEEFIKIGYTKVPRLKGGILFWQKKGSKASAVVMQSSVLI